MATATVNRTPGANAEDRKFLDRFGDKLSKSTLRAKWIHKPDERADRNGQTLASRSPEVVRDWAERRGATPVVASRGPDGEARTLRFRFQEDGGRNSRLEPIEWEEWLGTFESRKLVFLYQEKRRDGSDSNFFRLDNPTREDG
jgi:hypothetical protein